jgi:hypothetical protein
LHIWRISNHDIKTSFTHNLSKLFVSIKCFVSSDYRIVDETIPAFDIVIEIGKLFTFFCGLEPEREFGDLY